jgi:hypothetical protein
VSHARIGFRKKPFPGAGSISSAVAAPEGWTAKSIRNRKSGGRYSLETPSPASSHTSLRFGIVTRSCGWSVSTRTIHRPSVQGSTLTAAVPGSVASPIVGGG